MQHLITQATARVRPGLSCSCNAGRFDLSHDFVEDLFTAAKLDQRFGDGHEAASVPPRMAKSFP